MDQYKYRIWFKKSKVMHDFCLEREMTLSHLSHQVDFLSRYGDEDIIIMQYVGRNARDANFHLICEDDIVEFMYFRHTGSNPKATLEKGVIAYDEEGSFGIKLRHPDHISFCYKILPDNILILGNIHQNPELLESL